MGPSRLLGGRYRLDELIAAGGMGEVWRAVDLVLERPVAVKLLRAEYAQHEDDLARFRAEARHAGSVSHPGIAQIYDYHEPGPPGERHEVGSPDQPYLVMELVDGVSLARVLAKGPLSPARTMSIVAQAARALHAAHAAGLVHRDIKPGNLLICRRGEVKITDFGIAHAMGSAPVTRTGSMICTPGYLAPERAVGASATPATDLYSLGIVAYECLAGRLPFTGEPLAVALAHREKPLPPLPPSVPAAVAALVASLTAKAPFARPPSAAAAAAWAGHLHAALLDDPDRLSAVPAAGALGPAGGVLGPAAAAGYRHHTGADGVPLAAPTRVTRPASAPLRASRLTAAYVGRPPGGPLAVPRRLAPRRLTPRRSRATARPGAGAVLAGVMVGVLGLLGWMVASRPGQAAAYQPAALPPAAGVPSTNHDTRPPGHGHGPHVVAVHRTTATDTVAAARRDVDPPGRHHRHRNHAHHGQPKQSPAPPTAPSSTRCPVARAECHSDGRRGAAGSHLRNRVVSSPALARTMRPGGSSRRR